jgi:four helix bundle protein
LFFRERSQPADAVSALPARPAFSKDFELKNQLSRSSDRVAPLIAEGYAQLTDRHVAVYLGRARGSVLETMVHLRTAVQRRYISESEHSAVAEMYDHVGRMLMRWICYLAAFGLETARMITAAIA